jgi:Mrp family chromosome partitioning ATPase
LTQAQVRQQLHRLREQYDCVVIDAGPLLPWADALLISCTADAVLLAVRPGVSKAPDVHTAHLRLASLAVPFIAAVVCGGGK